MNARALLLAAVVALPTIDVQLDAAPATARALLGADPSLHAASAGVPLVARAGALWIGDVAGVRAVGLARSPAAARPEDPAALAPEVAWASAPQIGTRARLAYDPPWRVVARAGDDPLLLVGPRGAVLAADLDDPTNAALLRWGFLPFVLHAATLHAVGAPAGRFADWPLAPLPHRGLRSGYAAFAVAWAALLAAGFAVARRRARSHPQAHVELFARLAAPATPVAAAWTRPGMARPLGGFFLFLSTTLLAMGPYLYLTAVLIPSRVQPFPDVDGTWAPVEELAMLGWTLVDFGMTTACVQRFAEHRVRDPARSLASVQLFVWWQLCGGLLLFLVGGGLACGILPHTRYALLSRLVLVRAAMQVPGILSLFGTFFQATQRFDYQLGLDLLEKRLLLVLLPVPFVLALRVWGRAHPAVGEGTGALLGLAAGQYAAMLCTALVGYALYRRLRLPLAPLWWAGFDRSHVRDLARFGVGVVGGKAPFFLANAAEIAILTNLLPGYPAWLGIRQLLMSRLVFVLWFMYPFIDSGVPAFAEAQAAGKPALSRYYVVRYLQFGHLFVALVIAFLLGAGRPLLRHALSAEWHGAATYLPLAALTGLFLPSAWLCDSFQKGFGRAGLNAALLVGEQALRIGLFALLVPRLALGGVFVAVIATMGAKVLIGWGVNHRRLLRLQLLPWTTVAAPAIAGVALFALLEAAAALLPATRGAAIALFAGGRPQRWRPKRSGRRTRSWPSNARWETHLRAGCPVDTATVQPIACGTTEPSLEKTMSRPPATRILGATLFTLALGLGCGNGGGCLSLVPLPKDPQPLGLPTDQVIEGGIQARITKPGMDKLTATIPRLIKDALGTSFCAIPPLDQQIGPTCFNVDVGLCKGNGCAGNMPGCPANVFFNKPGDTITVSLSEGSDPIIHVEVKFDAEMPLEIDYGGQFACIGGSGSCTLDLFDKHYKGTAGAKPIDIVADIQASTDPKTGELTLHLAGINVQDIDLDATGCSVLSNIASGLLSLLQTQFGNTVLNFVLTIVKPQIDQLIQSFLPKPLGLVGTVNAGVLLSQFHPPKDANLELFVVPGGYVQGKAGGLNLGVMSGLNSDRDQMTRTAGLTSEPSLCVPARPTPDLASAPWMLPFNPARKDYRLLPAGEFSGNPDPVDAMNQTEDVAIGISRTFLDLAGFHIYNSGTLCLAIGGGTIPQLNAGTLSVIIGSIGNIVEDKRAGLDLVLRPQQPITFTLGAGTMTDPLIHVAIADLRIDFYAWLEERFARLITLSVDINAGLNLTVTKNAAGKPAIEPELVGIDPMNIKIDVSNTDLLQETPAALKQLFPSLITIATGLIGNVFSPIDLPSVAGFSLDDVQVQRVQTTQDDFIGIFGVLNTGGPRGLVDWSDPDHPHAVGELDTIALVERVDVPSQEQLRALFDDRALLGGVQPARPSVTLRLDAAGKAGRAVEWAYRVDGGFWRPWSTDPHPTVSDDAFLLQGRHTLEVRSRAARDWASVDLTPVKLELLIDSVAPELHPARDPKDGTRLRFGGFDIVSEAEALEYAWLDAHGKRTEWTGTDSLSIAEVRLLTDDGQRPLSLFARDEAGNVGQAAVDVTSLGFHGRTTNAPSSSGCGCSVGAAAPARGGVWGGALALFAGLLVFLRRRSSTHLLAALALAGLAAQLAGCGCEDQNGQCVVDDDCAKMKCAKGQYPQCQSDTRMCGCTPDLPPGDVGRFSSMALLATDAYIAAYNTTYGDLMIGHVSPPGVVTNWDFVDGVPDTPSETPGARVRGGISTEGDDVGRYTSIQVTPAGDPVIAYYDKTHGALKFASFGVIRWHSHTVDHGMGAPDDGGDDLGRWTALSLGRDGTPGIAYTAVVHAGTASGKPESQLRWAQAKTKNPQSPTDWTITVVDARPLGEGGPPAAAPPDLGGAPSGDGGTPMPADMPDILLPEGIALMASVARRSDGSPGIAYYDRTRGNLRYVEFVPSSGQFSMPIILDGEDAMGNDTADVGLYPSLTYDSTDVAHISYVDATHDDLLYVNSRDRMPEVADDGYRSADEKTRDGLDSPVFHLVGDSSSIQAVAGLPFIAYQDSTSVQLRLARRDAAGKWTSMPIAGHMMPFKGAYGFYASMRLTRTTAVISSYAINQQLDPTLYFVEVFGIDLGIIM